MLSKVPSASIHGIDAQDVLVTTDINLGLPVMRASGSESAVRELRGRITAAFKASKLELPPRDIAVQLRSADPVRLEPLFDLPVAIAILIGLGELPQEAVDGRVICGELGLDGTVRPIRGAIAIAELAAQQGALELILPVSNAQEAAALPGAPDVIAVRTLQDVVRHFWGDQIIEATESVDQIPLSADAPDLSEIRGLQTQKRALELAAAGGHNVLFYGTPSSSTMLARRLTGSLPPLAPTEAVALTKIHSLVAEFPLTGLVRDRPFRAPHSAISPTAMRGGGSIPWPGEVTLAHGGVLYLDDLPDFQRATTEALRQPLTDGFITIAQSHSSCRFPAAFQLVAYAAPGDMRRISPELLARFDVFVELSADSGPDVSPRDSSAMVAKRVQSARAFRARRPDPSNLNDARTSATDNALRLIDSPTIADAARPSLLRVARTAADLDGSERIRRRHVETAILYRTPDPF